MKSAVNVTVKLSPKVLNAGAEHRWPLARSQHQDAGAVGSRLAIHAAVHRIAVLVLSPWNAF